MRREDHAATDGFSFPATAPRRAGRIRGAWVTLAAAWRQWRRRVDDRRAFDALRWLDDRQLDDIGLIRDDVEWAAALPLWRNAALEARERARIRERRQGVRRR